MDEYQPRPQPPSEPPTGPILPPARPSRRWFLGGGIAVLAGAGAGIGAQFIHRPTSSPPPPAPAALVSAAAAERDLIADLDATTGGTPDVRRAIVQIRADHAAHRAALTALLGRYRAPAPSSSPTPRSGTPRTLAQLRAAEHRASSAAAAHAGVLDHSPAALLASIAACETTHAELLR